MTCNNVILAQPEAGTSVDYNIPTGESAKLSFGPQDIDGLRLDGDGGLIVSFTNGGALTIANFQSMVDGGNLLYLSDGTMVDPKLLQSGLSSQMLAGANDNDVIIGKPADGVVREITLEPGQDYVFDFALDTPTEAYTKDGQFIMAFDNKGQIVLTNYEEAMAAVNAPELRMESKVCKVTGADLVIALQQIAGTTEVAKVEEEIEEKAERKSKIEDADMDGDKVAKIAPASGDVAETLALVEPAAGEAQGAIGNSGYGFNSLPGSENFDAPPATGPLGPTALNYQAPQFEDDSFIPDEDLPPAPNDDVPVANDDEEEACKGETVTGNVTNNDELSDDMPNKVTNVSFDGVDYPVPSGGSVVVKGNNGTLTLNSDGSYSYVTDADADGSDAFVYTLTDVDGDSDTAILSICTTCACDCGCGPKDDEPVLVNGEKTVDETFLLITQNGVVTVDYGNDGPGTVTGTGTFASSGSKTAGNLTHNGTAITVGFDAAANTYVGTAGGTTIFTLVVNADGSYTYRQFENLDHADGNDDNDIINLTFGVKATDADGDSASGNVTIHVKDDAPVAHDDNGGNVPQGTSVSGNVIDNDDVGEDDPGFVITINFNGTSVTVPAGSSSNINGDHGVLTIHADGSYTYAANTNGNGVDSFTYTLRDFDGDTDPAVITFCVVKGQDDEPVIVDGKKIVDETFLNITETGTVSVNYGGDGPGTVAGTGTFSTSGSKLGGNFTHNGTAITTVFNAGTNTYTGTAGGVTIFTLTIESDGDYTYKQFENFDHADGNDDNDIIELHFGVKATDSDGDVGTGKIEICVKDDAPALGTSTKTVDETDLGPLTQTGAISSVDFGEDGPGTIAGTGSFTAGGSLLGGNLTSGGVTVNVAYDAATGTYTGTAGGTTVFTLVLQSNGEYTFKLFEQLDHADGSNPNDEISLTFGAKITDYDGESDPGSIVIKVKDDAPDAKDDNGGNVNEGETVTGNVMNNDDVGEDIPGRVTKITFNGTDVTVPNGSSADINGAHGVLTINSNGTYSYTGNNNANGVDSFTYTLRDYDGDTDTAVITFCVVGQDDNPVLVKAKEIVDESFLNITETGTVTVNYGGDGPGTVAGTGTFSSSGSKLGGNLTHNGTAVNVAFNSATNTYTGTAGGVTIFTLVVESDGDYTYRQFENLDHADGSNPNDIITLTFGVKGTDADGDVGLGTVVINVKDDAPIARDDDGGNVNAGESVNGNVMTNDDVGEDDPGRVIIINFNGTNVTVPAGTSANINGAHGVLTINSNGTYTYTANANGNGVDNFTYTLRDFDGDTDPAVISFCVIKHDDNPVLVGATETVDETFLNITETGNVNPNYFGDGPGTVTGTGTFASSGSKLGGALTHNGAAVNVTFNSATNTYTGTSGGETIFTLVVQSNGDYTYRQFENLDHADGSNPNDIITLTFGVKATDSDGDVGTGTITVNVKDDAPVANDDNGGNVDEGATVGGNVMTNDDVGEDDPGRVIRITFNGTNLNVPNGGSTTISGLHGELTIFSNGTYSYTSFNNSPGVDTFTYLLRDYDGDTDPANITFCVLENDDQPVVLGAVETVDETNLNITETGNVNPNYFGDGPGTVTGTGTFASSGSKLGGNLTHNGSAVNVVFNAATQTYTGTAAGKTIFTLKIDADGDYTYRQFEQLDHADGSNPNDIITLTFGVKATDADGDVGNGTVVINVKDDAPDAVNDGTRYLENWQTVSGNVTNNDDVGEDAPGRVTQITFGGTTRDVPNGGSVSIAGTVGTLTISSTGQYSFTANGSWSSGGSGSNTFTYRLSDFDGDTDTATIAFVVYPPSPPPPPPSGDGDGGGDGCPLVFDMDGDGIELISKENGVYFDMDEDGIADKTAWVSADDAILVWDKNTDGTINDHGEMFGNDEIGGFEMLSAHDTNQDGVINADDEIWTKLQLWMDLNGDGISQANEMLTLDQAGFESISLSVQQIAEVIAGNNVTATADATRTDGSTINGFDAWFKYDSGAPAETTIGQLIEGTDGADTFVFAAVDQGMKTLSGFNAAEGDKIDLSSLLEGQDDVTDAIHNFVFATEKDGSTFLSVDVDGLGGPASAMEIAKLDGLEGLDVAQLVKDGNIIV